MRTSVKWSWVVGALVVLAAMVAAASPVYAAPGDGVVHAILFYSPTCSHCHDVMTNTLPRLRDAYGDALVVAEVDTASPSGGAMWQAAVTRYQPEIVGVPTLIVGDRYLVGSYEIPERFPAYIEAYLAEGGVPWPDLPGLDAALGEVALQDPADPSFWGRLRATYTRDLAGNILSTFVLVGLMAAIVAVVQPRDWQQRISRRFGAWGMLVVLAVGLVAAGYLAYVETTGSEAVCGPVGDCNAVQQSEYAVLFGFLPIAVLGVVGYVGILVAYVYATYLAGPGKALAAAACFGMAVFGLLFSTYLTFLEPFVIGATCAWCLTSAVCMALIALMTAGPGWEALRDLRSTTGTVTSSAS